MSTPARSATIPLACSMTIRVLSAWLSWSFSVGAGEHDAGGTHVEDVDAAIGQQGEKVDDVEFRYEGVGELNHRPREHGFSGHSIPRHVTPAWGSPPAMTSRFHGTGEPSNR